MIRAPGSTAAVNAERSGTLPVRENTSKFSSLPLDARGFCTAAKATACVYVPQTAAMTQYQTELSIMDIQVDPTGCAARGGSYTYQQPTPSPDEHYQLWGWCTYTYPRADKTTFAPGGNVYVQQTCSDPLFNRTIRRGVVSIRVKNVPGGSSDYSPHWCAIRVAVGLRAAHGRPPPITRPKRG
ncbi:MAG TPA: hypothetical protein VHT05_14415 [Candidatus Elarobacter sp.]|nr:hypothetical protein [Candidatus Elarobacter sp.]